MIDFHTHLGHGGRTLEDVRRHIDAHGGGLSVLLPIEPGPTSALGDDDAWSTRRALEAHAACPDETIPFANVDPLSRDALERLRSLHEAGLAKGFGEQKNRLPVDHPRCLEIYRLCGEVGWPVLIHMDYTGVFGSNFPALEGVVRSLPETAFIGHAMAWWTNISADAVTDPRAPGFADYPAGPVKPVGLTDRLLSEHPNLYCDLSARSGYHGLHRDPEFARGFLKRHRPRLLWGTDCPCVDGRGNLRDGGTRPCLAGLMLPLLRDLCESDTHFDDITHDNGARLLGLAS